MLFLLPNGRATSSLRIVRPFGGTYMTKPTLRQGEKIKDISGYEGLYSVTTHGRVWSYPKNTGCKPNGGWLKPRVCKSGYHRVLLGKKQLSIHRLVMTTFIKNTHNKRTINHKNGIKEDNNIVNLEWATYSENQIHALETGLNKQMHKAKLSIDMMSEVCEAYATGLFNMSEIGRGLCVSHKLIERLVKGKSFNRRSIV